MRETLKDISNGALICMIIFLGISIFCISVCFICRSIQHGFPVAYDHLFHSKEIKSNY